MPTATGSRQSPDDLQRALFEQQRDGYRRLQRQAAEAAFERRFGRPAESVAEIERSFPSGTIRTIDPARHLAPAEVRRVLASATG